MSLVLCFSSSSPIAVPGLWSMVSFASIHVMSFWKPYQSGWGYTEDPPALCSSLWACPLQWLINHTENAGCTENTDIRKPLWRLTWTVYMNTIPWPLSPGLRLVQMALKCSDPWVFRSCYLCNSCSAALLTDGGSCSLNQNPPHSTAPGLLGDRVGGLF